MILTNIEYSHQSNSQYVIDILIRILENYLINEFHSTSLNIFKDIRINSKSRYIGGTSFDFMSPPKYFIGFDITVNLTLNDNTKLTFNEFVSKENLK